MRLTTRAVPDRCERCGSYMTARMGSYFTDDWLCMRCIREESALLRDLQRRGNDIRAMAGIGNLPLPELGAALLAEPLPSEASLPMTAPLLVPNTIGPNLPARRLAFLPAAIHRVAQV